VKVVGDVSEAIINAVNLIGGLNLEKGARVVIKPNVCSSKNPYRMVITDLSVLEAVIRLIKTMTSNIVVVESDNISGDAERRIKDSGVSDLVRSLDVDFFNLSKDDYETYSFSGIEIRLPKTVLEADYFINLPKMKTEGHVLVTLSMKNLLGVLQRKKKSVLHKHLDGLLPFLAQKIRNDLIIVDGIVAMEGNGPLIGTPKKLDLIIAGTNPVSVDSVCCRLMGFEPKEVKHIINAEKMGIGESSLKNIELVGDIHEFRSYNFEKPYSLRASIKSIKSLREIYLR
ncbi:DUF362 domain-containing protein, partial [Candidatus Bathyarchaeota archaeon]|nr:DUF362 domain-containing protein [Candidatus Bathyarchaeota archaeon]